MQHKLGVLVGRTLPDIVSVLGFKCPNSPRLNHNHLSAVSTHLSIEPSQLQTPTSPSSRPSFPFQSRCVTSSLTPNVWLETFGWRYRLPFERMATDNLISDQALGLKQCCCRPKMCVHLNSLRESRRRPFLTFPSLSSYSSFTSPQSVAAFSSQGAVVVGRFD